MVGMDQGRYCRLVLAWIAEHVLVYGGMKAFEKRLADRLLDQDPRPGQTHLAAVVVLACGHRGGGVEVGVFEDDEGAFAAEFRGEGQEVPGGGDPDQSPRRRRSGEGDAPQQRMGDERGAGILAEALYHVEDAGGEAGFYK